MSAGAVEAVEELYLEDAVFLLIDPLPESGQLVECLPRIARDLAAASDHHAPFLARPGRAPDRRQGGPSRSPGAGGR